MTWTRRWTKRTVLSGLALLAALPLGAQERDSIPGVALGLVYETAYQPAPAIKPFSGRFGGAGLAAQVEAMEAFTIRYALFATDEEQPILVRVVYEAPGRALLKMETPEGSTTTWMVDGVWAMRVEKDGEMDLVADLALPVPATLICEMLGVPVDDRDRFTEWTADATHGLALRRGNAPPELVARVEKARNGSIE